MLAALGFGIMKHIFAMQELMEKVKKVMEQYTEEYPEVKVDRDYYPLKITEEWGECLQAFLMLSKRGRKKGLSGDEMRSNLEEEFADVLGFLLLFAENEGIDPEEALEEKWFSHLRENKESDTQ